MKRCTLFVLLLAGTVQLASAAATPWETNAHGSVRLISTWDTEGKLWLGLHFKPEKDWYLYWKNPGEAGYPPAVDWTGSRGISTPELLWPTPVRILLPGPIEEFGYTDEMVYPVRIQKTGRQVQVQAQVSYLTCYTSCVPFRYTFTLDIPPAGAVEDPELVRLMQTAISSVPPAGTSDEDIMKLANTVRVFPGEKAAGMPSLLWMLLLAFAGGIILNLMPCVLPVLSIKLAGLLQHAGQSSSYVVKSSLAAAAGIVVSFEMLALVAVAAKRAGHVVGWGIQFQNPVFVTFLMLVVLFFALNLWGVFEIQMPRFLGKFSTSFGYHESLYAHFVSGLFATLLATPCSAPFLGTAMGFALSQEASVILMAFAAVGLGMGLPYLTLAAFPGSIRWLPKPGAWMITLKKGLSLLLVATAVWLGWVLYQQQRDRTMLSSSSAWVSFDESAIPRHLSEGKTVFVDVTADWCVTCKYNERFVLESSRVKEAFARREAVLMKADWTTRDAVIGKYLMKHGRAGIPFYAFYQPGEEPKILSEFLTVGEVLRALKIE